MTPLSIEARAKWHWKDFLNKIIDILLSGPKSDLKITKCEDGHLCFNGGTCDGNKCKCTNPPGETVSGDNCGKLSNYFEED